VNKTMELDLSHLRSLLTALAGVLALAGLMWLGHAYTPTGDKLLTPVEWRVLKARSDYLKESGDLQEAADSLASLLNDSPDPVRAQLVNESIQRLSSAGQPALSYQREKLAIAAQGVSDWAVGALDHETAHLALAEAIEVLSPEPEEEQSPSVTLPPAGGSLSLVFLPNVSRH